MHRRSLAFILAAIMLVFCFTFSACGNVYKVEFKVGDNVEKTYYSDAGGTVSSYTPKQKYGYKFLEWYDESDMKFSFDSRIEKDKVLKAKFQSLITGDETFYPVSMKELDLASEHIQFGDIATVIFAASNDEGYYIESKGYAGYHMNENPYISCGVYFDKQGVIKAVVKTDQKAQSAGYIDFINQAYLDSVYKDKPADKNIELTPATGATISSRAVQYAVMASCNYLENVLGIKPDTNDEERAQLNNVYPATYKTIKTDYTVNNIIGTVLYAAEGIAQDGTEVVAMKVRGSRKITTTGASYQGWDSQIPNSYTMIIVINKATDKIIAYSVVTDGTRAKDYFTVSDELHKAYQNVVISYQAVFDNYKGGLSHPDYAVSDYFDGSVYLGSIITGTTLLFTGATINGTFSSQLVRNCYRTAAYFYCNYE
jgi:Na+-translocating ferredoxin:NAD+ oxidoreductase RnfG subunit